MTKRSDAITQGFDRTPHRALLKGAGVPQAEMDKPFIGIATSFTDLIPGHTGMRDLERFIEKGVHTGGGYAFFFGIPGVCDGIAMGHKGMHYSLPTRELIADMVESVAEAHRLDGLILLTNCDKITPGMLMAAARLDIPCLVVTAGPLLTGARPRGAQVLLRLRHLRGDGQVQGRRHRRKGTDGLRGYGLPDRRFLPGAVHRQHHGDPHRDPRHEPGRLRHRPGGLVPQAAHRLRLGRADRAAGARRHHPAPDHDQGRLRKRHPRRRGPRRLEQHRAAPALHRPRGGGGSAFERIRPDQPRDPAARFDEPRRQAFHGGSRWRRRRVGGALPAARPDQGQPDPDRTEHQSDRRLRRRGRRGSGPADERSLPGGRWHRHPRRQPRPGRCGGQTVRGLRADDGLRRGRALFRFGRGRHGRADGRAGGCRRRGGDPLRGAQGRPRHAGDACPDRDPDGARSGRQRRPDHRRALLRRHPRPVHRPYLAGSCRRRADRPGPGRRPHPSRHPAAQARPAGRRRRTGAPSGDLEPPRSRRSRPAGWPATPKSSPRPTPARSAKREP